jgi:hypothetical protein
MARFPPARWARARRERQAAIDEDLWRPAASRVGRRRGLPPAFALRRVHRMTGPRGRHHHGRVDLEGFVRDGYVAIRGAVDAGTVAACREVTWAAMELRGVRGDEPGSWPALVQGVDDLTGEPLLAAYTSPALTAAYDELIGRAGGNHGALGGYRGDGRGAIPGRR